MLKKKNHKKFLDFFKKFNFSKISTVENKENLSKFKRKHNNFVNNCSNKNFPNKNFGVSTVVSVDVQSGWFYYCKIVFE